jgi:hypothetical protein
MTLHYPVIEKQLINNLRRIPPDKWLKLDRTGYETLYWSYLRSLYTSVANLLDDWFHGGRGIDQIELPLVEFCPDIPVDSLYLYRDYYLALYAVLYESWNEVLKGLEWNQLPKSPSELLIWLVILDCEAMLAEVEGFRYRPRAEYDFVRLSSKQSVSDSEQKKVDKFAQAAFQYPALALKQEIISLCTKWAKLKKANRIRQRLNEYRKLDSEMTLTWMKSNAPRKSPSGYQWVNGACLPLT